MLNSALVLVMVFTLGVHPSPSTSNLEDRFTEDRIITASIMTQNYFTDLEYHTLLATSTLGRSEELIRYINDGDRAGLLQYLIETKPIMGMDAFFVADHQGIVLARSHAPDFYGDHVSAVPPMTGALQGHTVIPFYMPTSRSPMVIASAAPIFDGNELIGGVVAHLDVGHNSFVDSLSYMFGVEIAIYMGDHTVASTIINPDGYRAIDSQAPPHVVEMVLGLGESLLSHMTVISEPFTAYYFPLPSQDGNPVGMVFVGSSRL